SAAKRRGSVPDLIQVWKIIEHASSYFCVVANWKTGRTICPTERCCAQRKIGANVIPAAQCSSARRKKSVSNFHIGRRRLAKFLEIFAFAPLQRVDFVAMILVIRQCCIHLSQAQLRVNCGSELFRRNGLTVSGQDDVAHPNSVSAMRGSPLTIPGVQTICA